MDPSLSTHANITLQITLHVHLCLRRCTLKNFQNFALRENGLERCLIIYVFMLADSVDKLVGLVHNCSQNSELASIDKVLRLLETTWEQITCSATTCRQKSQVYDLLPWMENLMHVLQIL